MPKRSVKEVPEKIEATFEDLKRKFQGHLSLVKIRGNYYVNETATQFSEKKGRKITVSRYIGKIELDGSFTEAMHRKKETRVKSIRELIAAKKSEEENNSVLYPDGIDLKLLETLSANGRSSVMELSKALGLSQAACKYRIQRLERRYGINYTVEVGPRPFNFFRYVALVRFGREKPDIETMRRVIEKEPLVQLALSLKGQHDLFLYMLAENTQLLEDAVYRMRSDPSMARYKAYWNVTYISRAYGYLPLRQEFIELLKEKVWHKSKEHPRRQHDQLLEREYLVLSELNKDGRISFTDLDKKLGLNPGASDYTYNRLSEKGMIERVTINMANPQMKYPALFTVKQPNISIFNIHRNEFMAKLISLPKTPANTTSLFGDIGAPYGFVFIMPIYTSTESAVKTIADMSKQDTKDIKDYIITDTIIGSLGFRRAPPEITNQYKYLVKNPTVKRNRQILA